MAFGGRRFARIGGTRRDLLRDARGGAVASYASILGPNLVEMWHSQLGIATVTGNVDTWTGQIGGRVIQAPGASQRPAYSPDGAVFGGKSVVQCAITGSKTLYSGTLASLAPINTHPWLFVRGRFRSTTSGVIAVSGGGPGRSAAVRNVAGNFGASDITTVNVNSGIAQDTVARSMATWSDGSFLAFQLDATQSQTAYALGIEQNMTLFCVGASSQSGGTASFSDYSAALVLVCSSYPGAALEAQVRAMAAVEFPP